MTDSSLVMRGAQRVERQKLAIRARRHLLVTELHRQLVRCGVLESNPRQRGGELHMVIGVSGGADSVALLLGSLAVSLRTRKTGPVMQPIAAHVNHHLRDSAGADQVWVQDLCDRFGVELHIEDVYPSGMAGNVSANARQLRYEALRKVAHEVEAPFVAVAHHAEDQFETVLMALCRGSGLEGMAGMPWSRPLDGSISLIRPLLSSSRADCEDFCDAARIEWREDPTNQNPLYARTRLRREVIPVLEALWPGVSQRVNVTAELVGAARLALENQLAERFGLPEQREWKRTDLEELPVPFLAAGLRRAALEALPSIANELSHRHLLSVAEAIRSEGRDPRRFDWPGNLVVKVSSKWVRIT